MEKENKRKIKIIMIGVLGMIALIVGVTFAVFSTSLAGTKTQSINSGCLKVEMSDNGNLNMLEDYPLTDKEGLKRKPYTYTIENTCSVDAYYETTINVMQGSTLANAGKIKVALDGDSYVAPTIESTLQPSTLEDQNITGVIATYKLDEGFLTVGQTKTFDLRTWIDYDVESINGTIENKVIVTSTANDTGAVVYNTNTIAYYSASKNNIIKNVNYNDSTIENGLIKNKTTNNETVYNYRGNPRNYITYGTYNTTVGNITEGSPIRWRILSTNTDGSINIITEDIIGTGTYSDAESILNSFYTTHLSDDEDYIKTTSTFCKEGETSGKYLGKLRVENNNPSATCNGTTVTKIGLPTADDLMFAGAKYNTARTTYLNSSETYITNTKESSTKIYGLTSTGIQAVDTTSSSGIRAVITLKANTKLNGQGTNGSPFYVEGVYQNNSSAASDENEPTIIYARTDDKWSSTDKKIEISAQDDQKITGYYISNTNSKPSASASGWEASTSSKYTTVNSYNNGTYYVYVKDSSGNVSDAKEVVVSKVDKVAPTCTIRVNSAPDETDKKTLTVQTSDTNIDKDEYTWDDVDVKTSTRKVGNNGVYTAHLKDLAGNTGTCSVTITSINEYYTIVYTANQGTGADKTETGIVRGKTHTLKKNTFTKTGYTFIGWNTNQSASTALYEDEDEVTNLALNGATATLYAIWEANDLEFANQNINKIYDSANSQTASIMPATNGTGTYTYSEVSEKDSSNTDTNYISISGTTITIAANTPANTYTYVIRAIDSNTNATKNATYTITLIAPNAEDVSYDPPEGLEEYDDVQSMIDYLAGIL